MNVMVDIVVEHASGKKTRCMLFSRGQARPTLIRGDVVVVHWDIAPEFKDLPLKLHS